MTIFPKLPVYLRTHFETFEHGQRVRDALKSMAGELEKLTAMEVETRDAAAVVTAAASSASSSSGTGEGGGEKGERVRKKKKPVLGQND